MKNFKAKSVRVPVLAGSAVKTGKSKIHSQKVPKTPKLFKSPKMPKTLGK